MKVLTRNKGEPKLKIIYIHKVSKEGKRINRKNSFKDVKAIQFIWKSLLIYFAYQIYFKFQTLIDVNCFTLPK